MNNKFIINVNDIKIQMNPIFKIIFVYPLEIFLYLFNYIYIAILTTYFKIGIQPDIIINNVKFNTDINIEYSTTQSDDEDTDSDNDE